MENKTLLISSRARSLSLSFSRSFEEEQNRNQDVCLARERKSTFLFSSVLTFLQSLLMFFHRTEHTDGPLIDSDS